MPKAIQITDDVYADLVRGKELAIRETQKTGDTELMRALMAMGIGAFAGWLIYKALTELAESQRSPITK